MICSPGAKELVTGYEQYIGSDPGDPVVVPAGSLAAFQSDIFHASTNNDSGEPRIAYITQYSPEAVCAHSPGRIFGSLPDTETGNWLSTGQPPGVSRVWPRARADGTGNRPGNAKTMSVVTIHELNCDVLVAGGGAAGVPCALAAAHAVQHLIDPGQLAGDQQSIGVIQQRLLRHDAFLIGQRHADPLDRAPSARVRASSEQADGAAANVVSGQTRSA